MRFFGFSQCKCSLKIVRKLTNQYSCPDSVHVLYISMELLAANCRCELKAKQGFVIVVLGSRISSSLKNFEVMKMSRTLSMLMLNQIIEIEKSDI